MAASVGEVSEGSKKKKIVQNNNCSHCVGCFITFSATQGFGASQTFFFLGLHLRHMEFPKLGSNRSCNCQPTTQPQQLRIQDASGPAPQLTATPDPQRTERGQGSNPCPHGYELGSERTEPQWELQVPPNLMNLKNF